MVFYNVHTPGEYNPPIAHYSQVNVPNYIQVGLLVGKNGRHFKSITYESGCKYIWYDKERNVVELWGTPKSINTAEDILRHRFDSFKPNKTVDELQDIVKVTNECTRQNGEKVVEVEGPEWAVHDYCNMCYDEFMIDSEFNIGENFWMKIVLI